MKSAAFGNQAAREAQALIVITDLCEARGYTTDAITARAELAQAMAIAEGEL